LEGPLTELVVVVTIDLLISVPRQVVYREVEPHPLCADSAEMVSPCREEGGGWGELRRYHWSSEDGGVVGGWSQP
jgi:hypothetical protein